MDKNYYDYMRSDKWKRKRQQVFIRYGRKCKACGTTRGPIQVHHLSYANFGNEPLTDFCVLCWRCHNRVTKYHRRNRRQGLRKNTMIIINVIKAEILRK